ncbi:MAG: tRNA (adenosine(37)-N6)-threonylcarbamoyltransferase complex dimerization subunit type 1 TsaB [Pseudomonadota bacterium]
MGGGPLLTLDASAARCAAAVFSDGRALALRDEPMTRGQAERLGPMIAEVLAEAGLRAPDLGGVVVCTGPGNFTSLRIAVAAARGLALGAGRPAVGVPRLAALAATQAGRGVAAAAATRGRIYVQTYETTDGIPAALGELTAIAEDARAEALEDAEWAVGPVAAQAALPGGTSDLAPLAALARLGARALAAGGAPRPAPIYLRPPDAAPPSEAPPPRLPA